MSEKGEFFEVLRKRVGEGRPILRKDDNSYIAGFGQGRDTTIEALKEMVVGEPIEGRLLHFAKGYRWAPATHFRAEGSDSSLALANELIGTDGEEVAVCVLRKEASNEE